MAGSTASVPAATVAAIRARLEGHAPGLADGRLLCVDGPAGSGKTTLAATVADAVPDTWVLHMDDFYEGWSGLGDAVCRRVRDQVLAPLAAGEPGHYRRYDWEREEFAELHLVPPTGLLVLEGVGAGSRDLAPYRSALVWVQAPDAQRVAQGLERDRRLHARLGIAFDEAAYRTRWDGFLADEARFFRDHDLPASADLRVDGRGRLVG